MNERRKLMNRVLLVWVSIKHTFICDNLGTIMLINSFLSLPNATEVPVLDEYLLKQRVFLLHRSNE